MKASQKLHALAKVSNYMDTEKVKLIVRSFIMSHFNYCPLVWMFHGRTTNSRIRFMKELCELHTVTPNPPLMNFLQRITQYQLTKETCSYL